MLQATSDADRLHQRRKLAAGASGWAQELAIRAALGAGRGRIARELLLESVLLGLMGGLAGVGVACAGLHLLAAIGPANLPRLNEITLDASSLGFTLLLSLLSGLLFGAIPALKYSGAGAALSRGSRSASTSREHRHSRDLMVVAQVAMALVLLVSALLMIRTFRALRCHLRCHTSYFAILRGAGQLSAGSPRSRGGSGARGRLMRPPLIPQASC